MAPSDITGEQVRQSRRAQPTTLTLPLAAPPVGPARPGRQLDAETRRFADEVVGLLHRRLLAGTAIGAVAFAVMILVALASPHGRTEYLSLTLYASLTVWYTALVTWLVRDRSMSLTRLRVVEVLALAAYAAHCARKDFEHYSLYWGSLPVDDQWLVVSHSLLNWVFLVFIYGILIPNNWRRSLWVLSGMAMIPLAVYATTWLSFPESRRPALPLFELFAMARVMAAAVAIAVFGAHKFTTLQRQASEARHLGKYRIKRRLSSGGMGEVYLAEHRLLNRPYAIKLIRPEMAANPTSRTRFAREIQAMARLTHWNTVEIVDYGHAPDGTFYYVMEYVDGLNLSELVDRYGPLNPGRVVYLMRQACAALSEAHAMGLIHRDIKPGNIMVTQQAGLVDVVKILDFGVVQHLSPAEGDDRLTRTGLMVGTPGYMSPEQMTGVADVRSDIYSLGAVGYFLLCGRSPFGGPVVDQIRTSLLQEPAPLRDLRRDIPSDLEAVIHRCLRRDPDERFADVHLLDQALAVCECSASWSSVEAAAWWRGAGVSVMAGVEAPGTGTPSSDTRI
ncbi:MAG TPA: serine/threonine-protein kinase [Planctomycetaceae bacterium]|nr:serine/threonine-protein kinase [Planctomycetaceae bacterium]